MYTETELRNAKSRDLLPLQCKQCGETFHLSRLRIKQALNPNRTRGRADFCSLSCAQTNKGPPITVRCSNCGKRFKKKPCNAKTTRHFCNRSCAARYNNTHKYKGTRVSKLELWLQDKLRTLYPELEFSFNQKDVINSELDIYIPSLRLAFELNGIFHYEPIYGPEKLASIQNNDQRKFQACIEHSIELCLIDVSKVVHFKENKAREFLKIIQSILDPRAGSGDRIRQVHVGNVAPHH